MPVNVSDAFCPDTAVTITLRRPTDEARFVDGIYQGTGYTEKPILASPQQPTYRELQVLPEGERDKDIMHFGTPVELFTASDRDKRRADHLVFKKKEYKVIWVGDWSIFGHTVALAVRERNDGESGTEGHAS